MANITIYNDYDGSTSSETSGDDDTNYRQRLKTTSIEFEDNLHAMTDLYGQTPPRTRFVRKQRERKQRDNDVVAKSVSSPDHRRSRTIRRNTLETMLFNEMCERADKDTENENKNEGMKEGSRRNKRNLKLLRGSERDLKLDVTAAVSFGDRAEKSMVTTPNIKVETKNRFRCLRSKLVDCEEKKEEPPPSECKKESTDYSEISPKSQSLQERVIFHDTFSFLIKLGSSDKDRCRRQMSREETRWQNELKDLIWLELQAHHAERSPTAQDEYLCKQREAVGSLLNEIMEYRFDSRKPAETNITPVDSVVMEAAMNSTLSSNTEVCAGCLSMYCRHCATMQSEALNEVEGLLARLEAAEALYPSSHAFAAQYPMYKSPEFCDRVKAMCLWYNMTKHQRLKVMILGKLLMMLHTKRRTDDPSDSGISSRSSDTIDSVEARQHLVRFNLSQTEENDSPTNSNNSASSVEFSLYSISSNHMCTQTSDSGMIQMPEDARHDQLDFFLMKFDRHSYRKYIEDVLKTRGLRRSLYFLDKLHTSVLRRARLTLECWNQADLNNSAAEEYEGDNELKRYGAWSPEAIKLNLPSYRAAFVFLSRVPLEVVHEFLRMRIEQKPEQPSVLSIRQLMRELREGLNIACIYRERFEAHSLAVTACNKEVGAAFFEDVREFDKSLKVVFEMYLDYLQNWVDMVQHESFHKNLIEDEWTFIISIAGKISNGYDMATEKFCKVACTMLDQAKEFLANRPNEIVKSPLQQEECGDDKFQLMSAAREMQGIFVVAKDRVIRNIQFARCLRRDIEKFAADIDTSETINELKEAAMDLRHQITVTVEKVQTAINKIEEPKIESDRMAMRSRSREIMHQGYKMGFEYHKELCKLFLPEERSTLARGLVTFALLWMDFVKTCCDRGRGLRPRWANQGLDYLMTVCEPLNTKHLTDEEFEELKTRMDRCISHVVGTATTTSPVEVETLRRLPRSRNGSPVRPRTRTPSSATSLKSLETLQFPDPTSLSRKGSTSSVVDGALAATWIVPDNLHLPRRQRVALAVQRLDHVMEEKLRNSELIGEVTEQKAADRVHIKCKRVTFTWQRGIKIGQGRFGKVYTVVNNRTGELLAMKEVQLQPGDHRAIRRVAEELKIFEGIKHKNLVHYHGVEIHREEMLIFMEFCAEGTLESLVAGTDNGLPEPSVRKYTSQLLSAVSELHFHGVVHRDIKTANIFLTEEGNCLKLGDFGSAVQIKAHTTMPGELKGFVGTQAYMAPEVFMQTESEGHGRAADVWSVGCCVVEMSSGKRPWAEYDSNYQIMFKVGMGESPPPPKHLSSEGVDFIEKCLQHDPKRRSTALELLLHTFARVDEDER